MKDPISRAARHMFLEDINDIITIHLGRNPVKGGSPPRDKSKIINLIKVDLE